MTKPLVAITSDFINGKDYLSVESDYRWYAVPSPYVEAAVAAADVVPMIVPSIGDKLDIDAMLDRVDGVLVTGSRSNVHPSNYGEEATDDHAPFDPVRDATTLPLIRRAIERGVPLLAICRGIQEMNVALGGTLTAAFQKNRNIEGHEYPNTGTMDERFVITHELKIKEGSCLAGILEEERASGPVEVNSLHTQALNQLGDGMVVEATAPDGTIEAVSVTGTPGWVVGVQWHPEYWAHGEGKGDKPSNTILRAFGNATRAYLAAKSGTAIAAE